MSPALDGQPADRAIALGPSRRQEESNAIVRQLGVSVSKFTRIAPLLVVAITAVAAPVAAAQPGAACAGPNGASALNQYCENVPTAAGGKVPGVGSASIASTLPPAITARIKALPAGDPRRRLLSLPTAAQTTAAPGRDRAAASGTPPGAPGTRTVISSEIRTGPSSIAWPLVLVIALATVALLGVALVRRHRRRPQD